MGEAKRRGTFAQRKSAAVQRDAVLNVARDIARAKALADRPKQPSHLAGFVLATAALSSGFRWWRR